VDVRRPERERLREREEEGSADLVEEVDGEPVAVVGGEEASAVVLQDGSAAVGASRWWRAAALHHPRPVYCRFFRESMRTAVGRAWSRRIGLAKRRLARFLSAVEVMSTKRQMDCIIARREDVLQGRKLAAWWSPMNLRQCAGQDELIVGSYLKIQYNWYFSS
jgi:hypothetical protein